MHPLYILASSCISPQSTFDREALDMETVHTMVNSYRCQEPDFTKYINPVAIRRMSRALKMGYTCAMHCLQQQPQHIPEAIMIGTGKGCLTDTEHFLHSIRTYNETALNATSFIHSTYNQLNGMIALNRKINSYNMTYVHRAFSFEHTLLDAALLFEEGDASLALAGSFDEMTDEHFTVKKQWGYWKEELIDSFDLLNSQTNGTIAGEGTAFYLLAKDKPSGPAVKLQAVKTLYDATVKEVEEAIAQMVQEAGLQITDIDLCMSGENGDKQYAEAFHDVTNRFDPEKRLYFKHLCGEYDTATSFATWLAAQVLMTQQVPAFLRHPHHPSPATHVPIRHILIYNNYFGLNQSLILISRG